MTGEERRMYSRVEARWPTSALTPKEKISGEAKDISMQGAFISCSRPLEPSETCLLTIKAPYGYLKVMAEVVWSNTATQLDKTTLTGMGVRFLWDSDSSLGAFTER